MTYVKYKDPAWLLFNKTFECLVPVYAIAQFEENRYGRRMAGFDEADDAQYSKQLDRLRLTILTEYNREMFPCLAEIAAMGVPVTLVNPAEDAVVMYDLIKTHLSGWRKVLQEEATLPGTNEDMEEVLEDLTKLDNLQLKLHTVAMNYIKGEPESMLVRKMKRRGLMQRRVQHVEGELTAATEKAADYKPMSLELRKDVLNRKKVGW